MTLKLQLVSEDPLASSADLVVVGVHAGATPKKGVLAALDRALGGGLAAHVAREEFEGKKDQQLDLPTLGRLATPRLILLGLGAKADVAPKDYRAFAAKAARAANAGKARSLVVALPEGTPPTALRALAEGVGLGAYRFTKYLTGDRIPKAELAKVTLALAPGARIGKPERAQVALGLRVADAVCIARDLVNEPPNELYPAELAVRAARMAREHHLKCTVFDRRELERRGMKLIVAVGRGSSHDPRLVHLVYTPAKKSKRRVVFVGKGLTFDSGGLCIKPAPGMGEMKCDMSGAANVVALLAACAIVQPDIEVHGIIAAAENMPDGDAYRPGDVFGSLDGKTVEIVNTDAEGRLVLADALAYARTLAPELIVDNATLTGACVVALGQTCSGFFASNDDLGATFRDAAAIAGESFWRLPLLEELRDQLKSDVADLKHTGDRWGGAISAALFLREFVGDVPWVHADVAGPVMADRARGFYPKGATGHGVLTFLELIERMA